VELSTELFIDFGQFGLLRLLLSLDLILMILELLDSVLLNLRDLVGKLFLLATDLFKNPFAYFLHAKVCFLQTISHSLDVPLTFFDQIFLFVDVVKVLRNLLSVVLKFLDILLLSVALVFSELAYAGIQVAYAVVDFGVCLPVHLLHCYRSRLEIVSLNLDVSKLCIKFGLVEK